MVTHIMLAKLKDYSPENLEKAKNLLLSMNGNIPTLMKVDVKVDTKRAAISYDLAIFFDYETAADFEAYVADPFHVEVSKQFLPLVEDIKTVFYEN